VKADGERPDYSGLFVFDGGVLVAKAERAISIFSTSSAQKKNRRRSLRRFLI
jgi:hypothetical protein